MQIMLNPNLRLPGAALLSVAWRKSWEAMRTFLLSLQETTQVGLPLAAWQFEVLEFCDKGPVLQCVGLRLSDSISLVQVTFQNEVLEYCSFEDALVGTTRAEGSADTSAASMPAGSFMMATAVALAFCLAYF